MKAFKLLGLALALALVGAALVGASTASATSLCEENTAKECPAAKIIGTGATLKPVAVNLVLETQGIPDGCSPSPMNFTPETNLGAGKGIEGSATMSIYGCAPNPWCPAAQVTGGPYKAQLTEAANANGVLKLSGTPGLTGIVFENCTGGTQCKYMTNTFEFEFNGAGVPAAIKVNQTIPLSKGGGVCGGSVKLTGDFTLPQRLTASTANLEFRNFGDSQDQKCGGSEISSGSTIFNSTLTSISIFSTTSCTGLCKTVAATGLPYTTAYSVDAAGDGTFTLSNPSFKWSSCSFGIECKYGAASMVLSVDNNAEVVADHEPLTKETPGSSFLCPASGTTLTGTYAASVSRFAVAQSP